jgi:predicted nucleic acid-binding protein
VILVDTSVWIDHLRSADRLLAELLDRGQVLVHPFVIGEVALGRLRRRDLVMEILGLLPHAAVAAHDELLHFIEQYRLFEHAIGYVDAHLLAATRLTAGATLWTRDKRLRSAADRLGMAGAPH